MKFEQDCKPLLCACTEVLCVRSCICTIQELHDRILDLPEEVLKEQCQLMPDLNAMLQHAEGGSPLQIAISSAIQALAGHLGSASLPNNDRQLGSTSTSSEPYRTQPFHEVMDACAEASMRLTCVKAATDHASCLSALQGLHRLLNNPEGACAVAQADWLGKSRIQAHRVFP